MKNYKKGFVIPLVITIIALLGIGGGTYLYINKGNIKNEKIISKNKTVPSGYSLYSNDSFSLFYPKNMTISASDGLSVEFVSDIISEQFLINSGTDNFHYLDRQGSIISAKTSSNKELRMSFEKYKSFLNSPEIDKWFKLTFMSQENSGQITVKTIKKITNTEGDTVTYYYEIPQKNKKGITQYKIIDTKPYASLFWIGYLSSSDTYSEDIFNTIQPSFVIETTQQKDANIPLPITKTESTNNENYPTAKQKGNSAGIKANFAGFRVEAQLFYNDSNSYETLCKNDIINEKVNIPSINLRIQELLKIQNTDTQQSAKIRCLSTNNSYAISITSQPPQTFEKMSYCVDSSGHLGNGNIDSTNIKCTD